MYLHLSCLLYTSIHHTYLDEIFQKNTYMQKIYPENTRDILEVFCLYEATGEYFDITAPVSYTHLNTITYNITNDLRNRVFDQIQVLPLKYIDATSHGDILGRLINDIDLIGQGLLQSFTSLLTGIATIVGTILIMAYIHFSVAVIVVVLTPLSLLVARCV